MVSAGATKPLRSGSWGLICTADGSLFVTNTAESKSFVKADAWTKTHVFC